MRADPVGQRLAPARLGVGVVRRAERRDEDVRACSSPVVGSNTGDRVARPVDEQLLAGKMRLPHRRRDALPPVAVALAEPAVGVAFGVLGAILLPEQRQRHARAASAPHGCATSPDRCAPRRRLHPLGGNNRRSSSASSIASGIGQLRPATAARRTYSPTAVLPIPVASPTKPPAHPQRMRQAQHVTYLPHRHSLRWHRSPPGCQGDRSADSTVDGSAAYAAITCCPQSPDCCPPCAGIAVRVAPDSAISRKISWNICRGMATSAIWKTT